MSDALKYLLSIITILVTISGWGVAGFISLHNSRKIDAHKEAVSLYHELTEFINKANRVTSELNESFKRKEPREKRENLWQEYLSLQRLLEDKHTTYIVQLQKHYGTDIRTNVMRILRNIFPHEISLVDNSEQRGFSPGISLVLLMEDWHGSWSPQLGDRDGYRLKMLKMIDPDTAKIFFREHDEFFKNNATKK